MSTQVEIDTSVLEQMDFESGCEIIEYWRFIPGNPEARRCSKTAYAVANIHTMKGCTEKTILVCKDCINKYKDLGCHKCKEPYIRNWMII
jgi:hypothetical protein